MPTRTYIYIYSCLCVLTYNYTTAWNSHDLGTCVGIAIYMGLGTLALVVVNHVAGWASCLHGVGFEANASRDSR